MHSKRRKKFPCKKRRGRPQKPLKEAFDEEASEMVEEEEDGEGGKSGIAMKEPRSPIEAENGNKRKRSVQDKLSSIKEENGGESIKISPVL
ncbi:hypothetical protein SAY87_019450 [Trapa incisa]|uniref:Uncharacterized protein n=1 Tax=Trapa incisa TaxID=236973 RepID=A0AAN7Q2W7_9MYRT|nr:hypothetical protein SAY87_019450 [Trapa incisa]